MGKEVQRKILMITRKVDSNDDRSGFVIGWLRELARQLDELKVICLEKGDLRGLPKNVEVRSVRTGEKKSRWQDLKNFSSLAKELVPQTDGVFCHMNPEYTLAVFPFAKFWRKKIVSWYAHSSLTWKVRLLEKEADVILTPSAKSFPLKSPKVKITGHGIDLSHFPFQEKEPSVFQVGTLGRLSPVKDLLTFLRAWEMVVHKYKKTAWRAQIVGSPALPEQEAYLKKLKNFCQEKSLASSVAFVQGVPYAQVPAVLANFSLFINCSRTGSIDKAVLEAMATGRVCLTSNIAFANLLARGEIFSSGDADRLASLIVKWGEAGLEKRQQRGKELRQKVEEKHSLRNLANKIIDQFYGSSKKNSFSGR